MLPQFPLISSQFLKLTTLSYPFGRLKTAIYTKIKTMTDQELDDAIAELQESHAEVQRNVSGRAKSTLERLQQERRRREEKKRIKKQNTVIIVVAFIAMCIYNLFFR